LKEQTMSSKQLAQLSVEQVVARVDGAAAIRHEHKIDRSGMTLAVAASAAGVTTDELLAVAEERARRHARRARQVEIEREVEFAY
jgi:aspartokinase